MEADREHRLLASGKRDIGADPTIDPASLRAGARAVLGDRSTKRIPNDEQPGDHGDDPGHLDGGHDRHQRRAGRGGNRDQRRDSASESPDRHRSRKHHHPQRSTPPPSQTDAAEQAEVKG